MIAGSEFADCIVIVLMPAQSQLGSLRQTELAAHLEQLDVVDREIAAIQDMLAGKGISELVKLPRMQDADVRVCMKLLMTMWAPNYISGDLPMTMLIAALRSTCLVSTTRGPTPLARAVRT